MNYERLHAEMNELNKSLPAASMKDLYIHIDHLHPLVSNLMDMITNVSVEIDRRKRGIESKFP